MVYLNNEKINSIFATFDERVTNCGDLKWSKDIDIIARRSTDNGTTWSAIETVVIFPIGKLASDPSMIVDVITNEIFLFYNYMDLDTEKDVQYLNVLKVPIIEKLGANHKILLLKLQNLNGIMILKL